MRIAFFTNNYLPNPYGVTGSIESFRVALEQTGNDICVFAPRYKEYTDVLPCVYRYPALDITLKFRFPLPVPYSPQVNKVIDALPLDIIHAQHPNLLGIAARQWARRKDIPLVFTWHTLYDHYAHFARFIPEAWAARYMIATAVHYANRATHVIVPTESVRSIITSWGVRNPHITAVPTGVDEGLFATADGIRIRAAHAIPSTAKVLVTISRWSEEKNVEFLFNAILPVLRKQKNVWYLVVGGGTLLAHLREQAMAAGVADRVVFAGEVPRTDIPSYYSAGDLFVYASKSETQGTVATEALYSGLPIVAVAASGLCDVVTDGKDGFLVSEDVGAFGAAVDQLLQDDALRHTFGHTAQQTAHTEYTTTVCAQKLLAVYATAQKTLHG